VGVWLPSYLSLTLQICSKLASFLVLFSWVAAFHNLNALKLFYTIIVFSFLYLIVLNIFFNLLIMDIYKNLMFKYLWSGIYRIARSRVFSTSPCGGPWTPVILCTPPQSWISDEPPLGGCWHPPTGSLLLSTGSPLVNTGGVLQRFPEGVHFECFPPSKNRL